MPFVSYAQNAEDVLLWRALKDVQRGTYIDVGANHPVIGSVTYAFYERGWRGINIEPVSVDYAALVEQRKGDINLQVAAGDAPAIRTLYQFGVRGLATLSESVVARHREAGLKVESSEVKVVPLRDICAEHVPGDVHFLKIDVEGSEAMVLRGMDFKRWRPWVLVIEATAPNSQEPTHAEWEPQLLEQGYTFCYFDGLSRYYVAEERARKLRPLLSVQPNVFDDFVTARVVQLQMELDEAHKALDSTRARLNALDQSGSMTGLIETLERRTAGLELELSASREAWKAAQGELAELRQTVTARDAQVAVLRDDPYFKMGEAIRGFAQRMAKRKDA